MRHLFSLIILCVVFVFCSFNNTGTIKNCDEVPELNKKILAFVKTKIKKTVGKGECWDLASEALNNVGAKWDHDYGFGREVNLQKDCIFPGDIMQFENVEIEYWDNNKFFHEDLQHHTAIIYEVKNKGDYIMAEQNTSTHGHVVSIGALQLKNIKKGKYKVFRPIK